MCNRKFSIAHTDSIAIFRRGEEEGLAIRVQERCSDSPFHRESEHLLRQTTGREFARTLPPTGPVEAAVGTQEALCDRHRFRQRLESLGMLTSEAPTLLPGIDDGPTASVCENYTCQLPVTTAERLDNLLQER